MEKQFIDMRDGKKIYVQIYNKAHKDFLLMLHGGPGQGSYDLQYQAEKLSESVNVIIFDQRGVLRSDRIEDNEPFGLEYLVEDCENIRNILGINRWSILGHSFGGMLALIYATQYPKSVKKVVFECPSFNFLMSMRCVYLKSAEILQKQGKYDCANELRKFAKNNELKSLIENIMQIPIEVRSEVYHNSESIEEVRVINSQIDVVQEQWENGKIHFDRLLSEGKIGQNYMELLSGFHCPSILILGKYDPICCKEQQEFYLKNSMDSKIILCDKSGHTPHNDEPYKFTDTVRDFLIK
jgi:proline iminopeptidase